MKTKKVLALVSVLLGFFYYGFSQEYNEKLLVKYDHKLLVDMEKNNLDEFELLNFFVEEGWYVVDMPDKKIDYLDLKKMNPTTGEVVSNYTIDEKDLKNFNPLEYNVNYLPDLSQYYKVGNTGKLIITRSGNDMLNSLKNEKRQSRK